MVKEDFKTKYESKLSLIETEIAIKEAKDAFEKNLSKNLSLTRVSAPLFLTPESGLNDDLNGTERKVNVELKCGKKATVVQSLAKWKRMSLHKYGFKVGEGIYTDMNAIRVDEDLSAIHSYYVDQWDWEKIIPKEERSLETLKKTVKKIYEALKETEDYLISKFPVLSKKLPESIHFISSQELEDEYPTLSPKERENICAKKYGAIFITGIGHALRSGNKHDGRAPDYDDWNINGDIIVYYEPLDIGLELSSVGVRVSEESLESQLAISGQEHRKSLDFHRRLLNKELPYTIGGGIGQSRICMFFLDKIHIGEVQASIWCDSTLKEAELKNINLL